MCSCFCVWEVALGVISSLGSFKPSAWRSVASKDLPGLINAYCLPERRILDRPGGIPTRIRQQGTSHEYSSSWSKLFLLICQIVSKWCNLLTRFFKLSSNSRALAKRQKEMLHERFESFRQLVRVPRFSSLELLPNVSLNHLCYCSFRFQFVRHIIYNLYIFIYTHYVWCCGSSGNIHSTWMFCHAKPCGHPFL